MSTVCTWEIGTGQHLQVLGDGWRGVWSPDGTQVLLSQYGPDGQTVALVRSDGAGQPLYLGQGESPIWSPDGNQVALINRGNLYLVNATGGEAVPLTHSALPFIEEPYWSADGQTISFAFNPGPGDIYVAQADGTGERFLVPGSAPRWSPDGRHIAFIAGRGALGFGGSVHVVDIDGGSIIRLASVFYSDAIGPCRVWSDPTWSPDGRYIAYDTDSSSNSDGGTYLVAAVGSSLPQRIMAGVAPSWSPDGQEIASSGFDFANSVCAVFATSLSSGQRRPLAPGNGAAWSPGGRYIGFIRDNGVYIIEPLGTGERKIASIAADSLSGIVLWSRDGQQLAVRALQYHKALTYIADLQGSGPARLVGEGWPVAWSPDGRLALTRHDGTKTSIWLVNTDGTGEPQRFLEGDSLEWSSDGNRIVFTR